MMKTKRTIGQKKMLAAAMPRSTEFWTRELAEAIPSVYPADFHGSAQPSGERCSASAVLPSELLAKAAEACGASGGERGEMLASAVIALVYSAYNGVAEDLLLHYSPDGERPSLPLRVRASEGMTFRELFRLVREAGERMEEHADYPVDLLMPAASIEVCACGEGISEPAAPLAVTYASGEGEADGLLTVSADASRYMEDTVRSLPGRLILLLEGAARTPEQSLLRLELSTSWDRSVSDCMNATAQPYSDDAALTDLFRLSFEARGNRPAILGPDGALTYAEAERLSEQAAALVLEAADGSDEIVAILADRSPEFLVGVLGILRAGRAYLPLDPRAPEERNARILSQSGARLVLSSAKYAGLVPEGMSVLPLDSLPASGAAVSGGPAAAPRSLAYVIFTSGSTGMPKGVSVSHGSAVNRIEWMQKAYPLGPDDVILHKTPATFDVSVWELFWWLIAGCSVALLPPNEEANPEAILEAIERSSATTLHFVPSMLNAFLDYAGSTGSLPRLRSLRRVFCSGEALSPHHVGKFHELLGGQAELINLYGPTEATVDVSYHLTQPGDHPVPIGRPIDNLRLYVVDELGRQRPVGMVGELCIAGVGVAEGYIRDPERTAERFVAMPRLGEERVYMTGDLARLRADGSIDYLGRNDRQVKVRGFRIELGEIEAAMTSLPGVSDALVLGHVEGDGQLHLYGFVLPSGPPVEARELNEGLAALLPKYMIPEEIVVVDAIPLTPNGKADRAALLALRGRQDEPSLGRIPPTTEEELRMAGIWESVLGVQGIGVTDNFFALGGNSINFVTVLALANEQGRKITFQQLFKNPTIRGLLESADEGGDGEELEQEVGPFGLVSAEDRNRMPAGIEDAYPMSMLQAGLVYQSIVMQGDNNYHDIVSYLISGKIDVPVFREAVRRLVAEQPIFRTSYNLRDFSRYMQLVHESPDRLPLNVYDLSGLRTREEQERWYEDWFWKEQHRSFQWESPGLVQLHIHILSDDLYRYSISQHNSALDGWSMNKVHAYLFQTYFDLKNGASRRSVRISGNDHNRYFIYLEQRAIQSEAHRKFWREQLDGAPSGLIPRARPSRPGRGNEVIFHDVKLPEGLSGKLVRLAAELMVPVKDILLASHIKFQSLLTRTNDVFTGYEIGGRPERLGAEDALGVFLNTMPFRVVLDEGGSWRELIRSVYDAEAAALPYRRYPMAQVKQDQGNRSILFETVFNFTHFYSLKDIRDLPGFDLIDVRAAAITEFPLRIEYSRHFYTDEVELSLHYHTAEYDAEDMAAFGEVFIDILQSMVDRTEEAHAEPSASLRLARFDRLPGGHAEVSGLAQDGPAEAASRTDESGQDAGKPDYLAAAGRIKEIWSAVLGRPQEELDMDDDFFLIGGSSLSAMKVSLLLDKQVPLKTIMQKSILRELALEIMIAGGAEEASAQLLQCLTRSSEAARSVVFFPYAGGNALNFLPAAKAIEAMDADIAVYALELPGHDPHSGSGSLTDFHTLARKAADEIGSRLGRTELILWGHCVGTALALEVARLLEERSLPPQKLVLAAKTIGRPHDILETIGNAERLEFADIAGLHAEWSGTDELSTLGEDYERHLVRSFAHDSIESNRYLLSLWDREGEVSLRTPAVAVFAQDDPATADFEGSWSRWSRWVPGLELKVFGAGGHYFCRTLPSDVAAFIREEADSLSRPLAPR
ncbi:amino acid adenylation domain-containing protein [Paenibacillus humicus]|uniref:amino acid adenylation domain-containing protein n=1 Tax=Paenibacillus humicus TaxID=412861 RepID=UPI003F13964B